MIADIHGKISRSGSNVSEILEDKLTGDIFGAIRYLSADTLLLPFLKRAYWVNPDTGDRKALDLSFDEEPKINFWPRKYPGIEPDIEICGNTSSKETKLFIEVKYKSGLSSDDKTNELIIASKSNNQLIKQMRVLSCYGLSNEKILIYLTEDGSYPHEIMDRVSRIALQDPKLSNVKLYWLSWHNITSIAKKLLSDHLSVYERRIANDIIRYCQRKGFYLYEYRHFVKFPSWKYVQKFDLFEGVSPYRFTNYHKWVCGISAYAFNITNFYRKSSYHDSWRFNNEC